MDKRFLISVVAVVFMLMVFGYVVHGVLLKPDYDQLQRLYREQANFPLMLPAHIIAAFAFVWLFVRTRDDAVSTVAQGVRFGLAIWALMIVHKFLIYYSLQPIPAMLAVKQIVFDGIAVILMGIVVAQLNAGRVRRLAAA